MKRRQTPIYSALKGLDIRVPKGRNSPDPPLLEVVPGDGLPPTAGYETPIPLVGPDPQPPGLIPLAEEGIPAAEAKSTPDTLPSLPAAIRLSAASHHFGEVPLGDTGEWTLTLANEAAGDAIISFLKGLPSDGFSLVEPPSLPLLIPPAGARVLTVRYAPDQAGKRSEAYLSIGTNDPEFHEYQVLLTGTAIIAFRESETSFLSPITNSLGMFFRYIPAGTFLMGSPEHEPGRNDDEVPHGVTLSAGFYMQITPVTQKQWQAVMGSNPSSCSDQGEDCPVDSVNWQDCQEFIKKLNVLGERAYRLPTEAEWEYACRAGSTTALANGELAALYCEPDPNLDDLAWYCGNSERRSHPVAKKSPNGWGLYDMHGNVAEWCQDWYGPYPGEAQTDPNGPSSGLGRVVRGGSWFSSAKNCRSAARFYWPPQSRSQLQTYGFRLVI